MGDRSPNEAVETTRAKPAPPWAPAFTVLFFLPMTVVLILTASRWLETSDRYTVDLSRVVPDVSEAGVTSEEIAASLRGLGGQLSIFDPDLAFHVRQAYESSPWVRRVTSVKRVFPRGVAVDLEFRQPYAAIRGDGVWLLADDAGDLLPMESDEPLAAAPLVRVAATGAARDPSVFESAWFPDAVREAVRIIHDLESYPGSPVFEELVLDFVDVSNYGGRHSRLEPEVVLEARCAWGENPPTIPIRWGRSTAHPLASIEIPLEQKMAHLEDLLQSRPGLADVASVDVRFDRVVWRARNPEDAVGR